jgi:large subunit ribosomal protein L21
MYAVIQTGGKQHRIEPGDVIEVELLPAVDADSDRVEFDQVLMVGGGDDVRLGSPTIEGATVTGVLVDRIRAPKIKVFKKKRRKGYKRTIGHRQNLLRVRIEDIKA